jgi:hypothetical protein
VRDWHDVWPEQLAVSLERARKPHDIAVFAMPGRDIARHVLEIARWAPRIEPDVVIYQWYVNDVEVVEHRPQNIRWWQRLPTHGPLRHWSYLYYFSDNRLSTFLPQPDRSYVRYILEDFSPGSLEWTEFERYFHALATRAKEAAPSRLLLLYPQVPFRGTPPLKPVHDRMRELARPHHLAIPPLAWVRWAGRPVDRQDAPWRMAVEVPSGTTGPVVETREYYMTPGESEINVTMGFDSAPSPGSAGAIEIVDHATNAVVGAAPLPSASPGAGWRGLIVPIVIEGDKGREVRFRLTSSGATGFALGSIDFPVDYGMRVVDLTEPLNAFNTHASIFDAHPNARAHAVMAQKVFEALAGAPAKAGALQDR